MRLVFVVNSSASSVTERTRVVIAKALAADHDVTVAETSRRGHATKLAQGAAADGADAVVVLGGDGTINEAANGLAGTSTALGVLPGGSTNVFARTLGFTNDPVEATGELLAALDARSWRRVGLGAVNGRAFTFHVGIGYDAAVVAQVERRGSLKRYAGHALFVGAAVDTWLRGYDRRRRAFTVEARTADGSVTRDDGVFGISLRTNPYTFLGERPLDVAPGAGLDTALTLVTLQRLELVTLLPLAAAALRGRGLDGRRGVAVRRQVVAATYRATRPLPYQVDGDHLGEADHFAVAFEPDALTLVVPDVRSGGPRRRLPPALGRPAR
ncbi:MAG TPA: diacylglycerol kinase family protein [Acidimicrobiales bacterium]|nr:diacylglycerol kinase family protein [Acidimicrobiales bacterium]